MKLKDLLFDGVFSVQVIKDADNETLSGVGVDCLGYAGVHFIACALKGEAANFSLKAQGADASNYSDAADLADTATAFSTTTLADAYAVLTLHNPQNRYNRPQVVVPNLAAATPVAVIAILYGQRFTPQSNVGELHAAPAAGTA